jgi:hypothetical protein
VKKPYRSDGRFRAIVSLHQLHLLLGFDVVKRELTILGAYGKELVIWRKSDYHDGLLVALERNFIDESCAVWRLSAVFVRVR